jgi:hypothetical protein
MFKPTDVAHESGLFGPAPELERLANLTKIATLPSGAGVMSAMKAETNEAPKKSNFAQMSEESASRWKAAQEKNWTPVYYKAKIPSEEAAERLGFEPFNYTERS